MVNWEHNWQLGAYVVHIMILVQWNFTLVVVKGLVWWWCCGGSWDLIQLTCLLKDLKAELPLHLSKSNGVITEMIKLHEEELPRWFHQSSV